MASNQYLATLILGFAAIFCHPSFAQDVTESDLVQRLDALERKVEDFDKAASSTGSAVSRDEVEELVAAAIEAREKETPSRPTVVVFGRTHLESLFFSNDTPGIDYLENPLTGTDLEDRIQFRRIRLGAQGEILENGVYRLELDFGDPSRPSFRDTYMGFEGLPVFQTLLIGNQKRPLGLDGWDSNTNVIFLERALPVMAFNTNWRRIGVQSYGHTEDEAVNWQVGVFELADIKNFGSYVGDSLQISYNTRLSGTPWYHEESGGRGYLHWGVSNMYADSDANAGLPDTDVNQTRFSSRPELRTTSQWVDTGVIGGAGSYDTAGLESVLNLGATQVTGEYLGTWVSRGDSPNLFFDGGYVQIAYFLTGEHEPWDRKMGRLGRVVPHENFLMANRNARREETKEGIGAWQVAARWSYLSLTDDDVQGGRQENVTLGVNWYWTPYSKMLFNLVRGEIRDHAPVSGYRGGSFTGVGVRFMMDF